MHNFLGVSVVSLDKSLETNYLSARVGDNVEIKCDVTGSPVPPIVWLRNGIDLASLNEEEVRVFSDGSLYLTKIQLHHAGNYTCHAQRNKDIIQTHVLIVHSKYRHSAHDLVNSFNIGLLYSNSGSESTAEDSIKTTR